MNEWFPGGMIVGMIVILFIVLLMDPHQMGERLAHDRLCPTILESITPADSLAVFQEHDGCWDYVQRGTP